jgi:hypothetical protein
MNKQLVSNWLFSHWREVILFSVVGAIYVVCTTPAPTWFGLDC